MSRFDFVEYEYDSLPWQSQLLLALAVQIARKKVAYLFECLANFIATPSSIKKLTSDWFSSIDPSTIWMLAGWQTFAFSTTKSRTLGAKESKLPWTTLQLAGSWEAILRRIYLYRKVNPLDGKAVRENLKDTWREVSNWLGRKFLTQSTEPARRLPLPRNHWHEWHPNLG